MSAKEIKLRSFSLLPSFPSCCEPMTFVRQASAAVALITLSLWLQCGGMAALIGWARTSLGPDTHKLGPLRSAVLMVRFTTAIIALHVLQILLWATFYRWICLLLWESAFYFSRARHGSHVRSRIYVQSLDRRRKTHDHRSWRDVSEWREVLE